MSVSETATTVTQYQHLELRPGSNYRQSFTSTTSFPRPWVTRRRLTIWLSTSA
jgi:hypothetical protein